MGKTVKGGAMETEAVKVRRATVGRWKVSRRCQAFSPSPLLPQHAHSPPPHAARTPVLKGQPKLWLGQGSQRASICATTSASACGASARAIPPPTRCWSQGGKWHLYVHTATHAMLVFEVALNAETHSSAAFARASAAEMRVAASASIESFVTWAVDSSVDWAIDWAGAASA